MRTLIAILCLVTVGTAFADDVGWYVGVRIGQGSTTYSQDDLNALHTAALFTEGLTPRSDDVTIDDDSDASWSIVGGYSFSRYIAIEATYTDLGALTAHYAGEARPGVFLGGPAPPGPPAPFAPLQTTLELENAGFGVLLQGRLPLGSRFDLHASVGVFASTTKLSVEGTFAGMPSRALSVEEDGNSSSVQFGAGAGMDIAERWRATLDWNRTDVGNNSTALETEGTIDVFALGLMYRF